MTLITAGAFLSRGGGELAAALPLQPDDGAAGPPAIPEVAAPDKRAAESNPKLSSSLADVSRAGSPGDAAAVASARGLSVTGAGVRVIVEMAEGREAAAEAAVASAGGSVEKSRDGLVQALVPASVIKQLSTNPAIKRVREPMKPITHAVTSEGVSDIGATAWQTSGQTGAGVKVAVIDPGFQGYDLRVASGDLPAGVITRSERADGNIQAGGIHGTGCAEIVYDVAPGATIYLINFETELDLADAIQYATDQGITVISSSWTYPASSPGDGSGQINQLVAGFAAAGGVWTNAAGNAAVDHWSGPFTDADGDGFTEFSGADETEDITASAGATIQVFLSWNRWPVTDQDYDLYLYKQGNPNPVAWSYAAQGNPPSEPNEFLAYRVPTGQGGVYLIRIDNYSSDGDATFDLFAFGGSSLQYSVAQGSLAGQPADSSDALTVGAVDVGTTNLEYYSSQGPTADGRTKPDIAAPDCVTTQAYGPGGFCGTSASTPHTAGAAVLMKGAHPEYSAASIRNALESRAADLGAPGKDNLFGSGKLSMGETCFNDKPSLSLSMTGVHWASYEDYVYGLLSVDYRLTHTGGPNAYNVMVVDSTATNGAILTTAEMPVFAVIGSASPEDPDIGNFTLIYSVPPGVQTFRTTTSISASDVCGTTYTYP